MKRRAILLMLLAIGCIGVYSQPTTNVNPLAAPININLPRTPESSGFEKYGSIPVNDLTGTPNISIPLYSVKGKFLEVPLTVTYDASGIRVGQEASMVGLGFNLQAGGRITVETRGAVDNHPTSAGLITPQALAYGMQKLFTRLGNGNNAGILTFAATCFQCDTSLTHNIPDDWTSINAMAQFGVGEPDIFHANFLGQSFSYFYDKITGLLRFIGEKNLFQISYTTDFYGRIISWRVIDNQGVTYHFNQQEFTSTYLPPLVNLYGNSSTTAWLLTSVVHPEGDSIVFSYANYGKSYPAFTRNASISFEDVANSPILSSDGVQDTIIQEPAYLTKIESKTTVVDFVLGNRDDIKGAGSKRLDTIRVRDRLTGTVKKKISFDYSYFNYSSSCFLSLPDSVAKYYELRLKLNALTINDTASQGAPYQFYYYNDGGMPDKYSSQQDHWGYYNGSGSPSYDPCTPKGLLPGVGVGHPPSNFAAATVIDKIRDCSPLSMPTLTLDSIVYPTGGSTKLIYEPHYSEKSTSFMNPAGTINGTSMITLSYTTSYITGGGQRIKEMRNYALGRLAGTIEYLYTSGLYMGSIQYATSYVRLWTSPGEGSPPDQRARFRNVLSINGAFNDNDFLVGYRGVAIRQKDAAGASMGLISKGFKITPIYYIGNNGLGFDVQAAHWPVGTVCDGSGGCTYHVNSLVPLAPSLTTNAPSPAKGLDGKLVSENYYNPSNQLVKSVEYFYSLKDYSQDFYSVRAQDNLIGSEPSLSFDNAGARRYTVFVAPAKSYFALTDSVIEKTFSGSDAITVKKAFKYNEFYQQVGEILYNSDGTQNISLTKTSREMEPPHYPISPTGEALLLNNLRSANINDAPIEQMQLKRTLDGDTLLLQSRLNIYQGALPLKVYGLESSRPLGYKTEFIPVHYTYPNAPNTPPGGSNYTVVKDTRYKLYSAGDYSQGSQLKGIHNLSGNSAYIWDEHYNTVLAQCTDADSSSVAYSSFETNATGRWSYTQAAVSTDITAPTGSKRYTLSTGNITLSGLNSAQTYIVSFWKKTGSQSVNGKTGTEGKMLNGWTYTEYKVTDASSVTISGSGYVDEVRLYPSGSQMTSYTYEPLVGISAQADPASRISYYEYDVIGRLIRVRDQDRNLVRMIAYKQKDIFTFPYANTEQTQSFTTTCGTGYVSTVINYTVPENKYGSMISIPDANAKAQAEITAAGPSVQANCTCVPYYIFAVCCGWGGVNSNFALSGSGSVNFSLVLNKNNSTAYGQIGTLTGPLFLPSADRFVTVSSQGQSYTLVFRTTGVVEIMGPNFTGLLQFNGSYNL